MLEKPQSFLVIQQFDYAWHIMLLNLPDYWSMQVKKLIDYYSGEPIKDILTNTAYTVLGATMTFLIGYSAITLGPIIAMISTEKQLFDTYNTILNFVVSEEIENLE